MKPIILIPGIEATALVNSNSFDYELTWNAYDSLSTSIGTKIKGPYLEDKLQEDPLYDENIKHVIERNHIARLPYERAIHKISSKFKDDPIYLFGYDWRLSNTVNGKRLSNYVNYLKNKLSGNNVQGFRFITHSMGGLVFSCYLNELNGDFSDINKVILCAPPFRGSPYAVVHFIKGDGGIKSFLNKIYGRNEDIRKVVRTYPSLYELTPWYKNSIDFEDGTPVDLTNIDDWQSNIWDDIRPLFINRLDALKAFRNNDLCDFSTLPKKLRSKMIIVVGSKDEKTVTKLNVIKQKNHIKNFVRFDNMEFGSGDGTVPFDSATIYKDSVRTIEVEKENIFNEPGDNLDFHGLFLQDSRVQNIIIRALSDRIKSTMEIDKKANEYYGDENKNWWESIGDSVKNISDF